MPTRTTGLWMPNGDFMSFESTRSASVLTTEFATSSRAMGFDPASFFGLLPDPDPVLRKRGEDAEVLKELEGDDEVSIGIEKRTLRTQNKTNYTFNPGKAEGEEPTDQAIAVCKMLEHDLSQLTMWDKFGEILETVYYGPTFTELMWERRAGGGWQLIDFVSKPRDWFGFDGNRRPVFMATDNAVGEPLPQNKFVVTTHRASFDNPYGKRLLTKCLWPVAFKRGGIEFWTRFCEKFGSAFMIAKAGNDAVERNVIASQLVRMIQDAVAVLPPNADAELVQASSRAGDLHKSYVSFWNKTISKVLTGQHLASDQDGQGSLAASETHSQQLDELAASDEAMLVNSLNQLSKIYTRVNAGDNVFPPVFEFTEPEDYKEKAELGKILKASGVEFKKAYFVRNFGLSEDEFDVVSDSSSKLAPALEQEPAAFAAQATGSNFTASNDYQQAIDRLAEDMTAQAVKINKGFVAQLEKIVQQAESVEDLHARLAELLGQELDQQEMEELLSNAMVNAQLAGRAAAHRENDD